MLLVMTGVTVILRHQLRQPRDMPVGTYDFEVNLDDGSEGKVEKTKMIFTSSYIFLVPNRLLFSIDLDLVRYAWMSKL